MEKYNCANLVFSSSSTLYKKKNNNTLIKESSLINLTNNYGNTKSTFERL